MNPRMSITRAVAGIATLLLLGAGCGGGAGTPTGPGPRGSAAEQAAALETVTSDARNLLAELAVRHAATATYPATSTEATETIGALTDGTRVAAYTNHGNTNVIVCLANDTYGAWVRWDAVVGHLGSGTGATGEEISGNCAAS